MIIVNGKRREKVNVQRPCTVISLGQQIRQGTIKPSAPVLDGASESVTSDNLRVYNNMERLSKAVTAYDSIAARDAASRQKTPQETPQKTPQETPQETSQETPQE